MRRALGAIVLALLPATAPAQAVVGRAMVEGKVVLLHDDHSWSYEEGVGDCDAISAGLEFCGRARGWMPAKRPSPDFIASYRQSATLQAGYIFEPIGRDDGLTTENVRTILLGIAEDAAGMPPLQIESAQVMLSGIPGETMVYGIRINGLPVVYANTFVLTGKGLLQALTWEVTETFTETHRKAHADFLAATGYKAD